MDPVYNLQDYFMAQKKCMLDEGLLKVSRLNQEGIPYAKFYCLIVLGSGLAENILAPLVYFYIVCPTNI